MKKLLLIPAILFPLFSASAQDVNYDESKVAPYTLENPLAFVDGSPVACCADWAARRSEILDIFQHEMYGLMPPASPVYLETLEEGVSMGGFALRKQVRMWFRSDRKGPSIDWLIMLPTQAKDPVPAVISLNYDGNHSIIKDEEVLIDEKIFAVDGDVVKERGAGHSEPTIYPIELILARGYAFVTSCYINVSPDPEGKEAQDDHAYTGIFELWGPRDPKRTDNTTSLMAWAWALCRGLDMLEKEDAVDASRVLVTGCSRLAKAALIAGAFDDRFAVVAPIQTGGGGVPLAKRNYGENVTTENIMFTHWYCKAYKKYAGHEDVMPFDQHLLCSCVAPRSLLVGGFNEGWFDTKGEFLSLKAASPVWEMFYGSGLPGVEWPADYSKAAIGERLGYYRRPHGHGIAAIDWTYMLDFAEPLLKPSYRFALDEHIGVCTSVENSKALAAAGGSYIEVSVSSFLNPESSREGFESKLATARASSLPILSANGFFPGDIKLVGPSVDTVRIHAYVKEAMKRAEEVGIRTIVFGSGGARNVPEGFDRSVAEEQFCELCRWMGPVARAHGVTVVIEPLRTQETNFINSVREGTYIARKVADPNICVLADFYHMTQVGEDAAAILEAGPLLRHCHIAENASRTAPGTDGDDFTAFFKALKDIEYQGCISLECGWSDFNAQLAPSLSEVRKQIRAVE